MKILAFVPARSGSKSIKNKNMVKLKGRPLIYYTLNILSKVKKNTFSFVSTDDKKIKNYCKKMGFKNNYLRPKNLSGDKSKIMGDAREIVPDGFSDGPLSLGADPRQSRCPCRCPCRRVS